MKVKSVFILWLMAAFLPAAAQTQEKNTCEGFCVVFYSECCGVNREAVATLAGLEIKYTGAFRKKNLYFGKEGEIMMLFVNADTVSNRFTGFAAAALDSMNGRFRLVTTHCILEYLPDTNTYIVHAAPFGLNQENETAWYAWLNTFEARQGIRLFRGWMINETHIEEEQDKRCELDLGPLSPALRKEFMLQTARLLTAGPVE